MSQEVWKDVLGYEGLYEVSNHGRIKSPPKMYNGYREVILKQSDDKDGYKQVSLYHPEMGKKTKRVHQLMCLAFIPNPDNKPLPNHKDGIKFNNWVENLEWMTLSENVQHADQLGLRNLKGTHNSGAKLDDEQILTIRERIEKGEMQSVLAAEYNVSRATICMIFKRKIWTHI